MYVPGTLVNTNTVEDFRDMDKQKEFDKVAKKVRDCGGHACAFQSTCMLDGRWFTVLLQIVDDIDSGAACEDPSLLSQFLLLTYAGAYLKNNNNNNTMCLCVPFHFADLCSNIFL